MRFTFIAKHRGIWPVTWLCEALDVSRSGFHAWLTRTSSRHVRGRHFETLLTDFFNAWGMDARGGFHVVGEQIDGSFQHGNDTYLLEANRRATNAAR